MVGVLRPLFIAQTSTGSRLAIRRSCRGISIGFHGFQRVFSGFSVGFHRGFRLAFGEFSMIFLADFQ